MIRRADAADHAWIALAGAEAYRELGDYARILPSWLGQPGVLAWVEDAGAGELHGFAMLGFYVESELGERVVADLLALAVRPAHQGAGLGTRLLRHVIEVAERVAPVSRVDELRLTVAAENLGAQRLYLRHGFHVVPGVVSTYDRGQRALRMARPLGGAAGR